MSGATSSLSEAELSGWRKGQTARLLFAKVDTSQTEYQDHHRAT